MTRTLLSTAVWLSLLAASAAATATELSTSIVVAGNLFGQSETAPSKLTRNDVDRLLISARAAMRQGNLQLADELVTRAEQAKVRYNLFSDRGDTPRKARRDLEQLQQTKAAEANAARKQAAAEARAAARELSELSETDTSRPAPSKDPFTEPSRTPPKPPRMASSKVAEHDPSVTYDQPATAIPPGSIPTIDNRQQMRQISRAILREARLALAVGDVKRARSFIEQASSLDVSYGLADDSPAKIDAATKKYQQIVDNREQLKASGAWRSEYGQLLYQQAEALLRYGELDEAERLANSSLNMGAGGGPYAPSPEALLNRIASARQGQTGQASASPSTTNSPQASLESPAALPEVGSLKPAGQRPADPTQQISAKRKQQLEELLSEGRSALQSGDLAGAERLAMAASNSGIPEASLGDQEDRPSLLIMDIHRAKRKAATIAGPPIMAGPPTAEPQLEAPAEPAPPMVRSLPNPAAITATPARPSSPSALPTTPGSYPRTAEEAFAQTAAATDNLTGGSPDGERPEQTIYSPEYDNTRNVPAQVELNGPRIAQAPSREEVPPEVPAPLPSSVSASPVADTPYRLVEQGEAALAKQDTLAAINLFRQAYDRREELDVVSQQRLQGYLQMLMVDGTGSTTPDGGSNLLQTVDQQEAVQIRQVSAEVARFQAEAIRLKEQKPKQALEVLEKARQVVAEAQLREAITTPLTRRIDSSVADIQRYMQQHRAELELDERNDQVRAQIDREQQVKVEVQERIAVLVDEFNQLRDEQRYHEMEIVAQRLNELAPDELVVQQIMNQSKFIRRSFMNRMLQDEKEGAVFNTLYAVEDSAIPFDDNNPIVYDENWPELSRRRRERFSEGGRQRTPRELEIERTLRKPVLLEYTGVPLASVISGLSELAGVNIHLDPLGLSEEGISSDSPITINLNQEISLESALNLILTPLRLGYVIEDEVLKVTSEHLREGNIKPVVYDVADLVIPIPNFTPSSNMGLQAMINDAHAAMGYGGGGGLYGGLGGGPISLVNNMQQPGGQRNGEVLAQQMNTPFAGPNPGAVPLSSGPGGVGGAAQADFESLIELITTTVAADSWDEVGGPGSIKEFPTNLSLVISQTQEVHEEIADLLEQLRRLQDLQVTIEVRFIRLNDTFFERIGVDFDFLIEDGPGVIAELGPPPVPGQRVEPPHPSATVGLNRSTGVNDFPNFTADLDIPFLQESFGLASPAFGNPVDVAEFGFAILSDIEAYFIVQAAQGDRRSNVLEAPKVTLFNGQSAIVSDTIQRPFVISVIPVVGDFAAAQQPVIVVLNEGTLMTIQAVVSDDRRYVRMTVVPFFSQIGDVQEFTFEGSTTSISGSSRTDTDDDGNNEMSETGGTEIRSGTTVQLPTFQFVAVSTTVSVPDGGTVLLGGIKRLSEGRNEFGVPLLSKVPYINRLFKNVGIGRSTESLMMMVTPRIIIQEEEEEDLLGTPSGQ